MSTNEDIGEDVARSDRATDDVEGWNMISLSQSGSIGTASNIGTGSNTPMTNSSCEFVKVSADNDNSDMEEDGEPSIVPIPEPTEEEGNGEKDGGPKANTVEAKDSKDEELRHLMEILQERVRSGSPSHSISADSDFICLQAPERDEEEAMDVSTTSSVASRFNIIVNRDPNPYAHSESEDEDERHNEEDVVPDADDRVESDIVVLRPIQEVNGMGSDNEDVYVRPVRHYRHSPNSHLNTLLTGIAVTALGFAIGIAIGHSVGSSREAQLQQEIQEGQKLRLKSVQDDLLMCLRKQEDIDQTITKLNEGCTLPPLYRRSPIENILVDAEHWRNEYEELLNIKLQNEEKWRQERAELKLTLSDIEKSHDRLIQSKSCAHDSEFLSRQESTLKSVHEKLEANLSDKDQMIDRLQTEMAEVKVGLRTAEQMVNGYRKSNEDKSLLILSLKEQILELEREAFDKKIDSEMSTAPSATPPHDSSVSAATGDDKQQPEQPNQQGQVADNSVSNDQQVDNSPDNDLVASLSSCQSELMSLQTALEAKQAEIKLVYQETVPVEVSLDQQEGNDLDVTSVTNRYEKEVQELKQEKTTLESKVQKCEESLMITSGGHVYNTTNTSTLPCVTFNFCDHLQINVTSEQILRFYTATKGQYENLQAFLLAEWNRIVNDVLMRKPAAPQTSKSPDDRHTWERYLDKTKSTVTEFWAAMNSTWQDLSQTVGPELKDKTSKLKNKVNKKFNHLSSVVGNGLNSLKKKFSKQFNGENADTNSNKQHKAPQWAEERNEPRRKHHKFEKRLQSLKKLLQDLDVWRVEKMKRYEKKDIYEHFDDFSEDYSYLFSNPDLEDIRMWVECQRLWWRQTLKDIHIDTDFEMKCGHELASWQKSSDTLYEEPVQTSDEGENEVDGAWQYERAEMRKFHRDEPDDWFWRRSHDYEETDTDVNVQHFPDEL